MLATIFGKGVSKYELLCEIHSAKTLCFYLLILSDQQNSSSMPNRSLLCLTSVRPVHRPLSPVLDRVDRGDSKRVRVLLLCSGGREVDIEKFHRNRGCQSLHKLDGIFGRTGFLATVPRGFCSLVVARTLRQPDHPVVCLMRRRQ